MKLHPRVTRAGVELVKRFEGLRRHAAQLPDGGWTIGYGHTRSAREGATVTPEDAEALLYYDLSEVAQKIDAWTFTPLNQNQFEALAAFAFNIGLENFRHSTALQRLNEGHYLLAAGALELWRRADVQGEDLVIDALVRRRAAEKAHFLTPPEGFRPSPSPVVRPTYDQAIVEAAARLRSAAPEPTTPEDGAEVEPPPFATVDPFPTASDRPAPLERVSPPDPFEPPVAAPDAADLTPHPDPRPDPFRHETNPAAHRVERLQLARWPAVGRLTALGETTLIYLGVGLVGLLIFLVSLVSMFVGKAGALNLAGGVIGILLMIPAGSHLLLARLDRRNGSPA